MAAGARRLAVDHLDGDPDLRDADGETSARRRESEGEIGHGAGELLQEPNQTSPESVRWVWIIDGKPSGLQGPIKHTDFPNLDKQRTLAILTARVQSGTSRGGTCLTAEIAILNKTAVAMAADSAVTISAGSSQEKIYDTADKLFELSNDQPIGVMINNDMNFMETPLPVLIKEYRSNAPAFKRVQDAADDFLLFLHKFGMEAPKRVKLERLRLTVVPILKSIESRTTDALMTRLFQTGPGDPREGIISEVLDEQIAVMRTVLERAPPVDLIGGRIIRLPAIELAYLREIVGDELKIATPDQQNAVVDMLRLNLQKGGLSGATTGLIVAGFGSDELFPTLMSYRLEGMLAGRLKFVRTNAVDIDRDGERARVLPFAQREMVERFLYGLDAGIERQITNFCKNSVPKIRQQIVDSLEMSDEDRAALLLKAEEAERAFLDGLADDSFAAIRQQSKAEIEDMVEFMPKPEMAKMAEALVNLTSIKRRVSRGMETVGGPIDVAVISKAEGFVWVKRKHYFTDELNYRFFDRMRRRNGHFGRMGDGENMQPRVDRA